MNFFKKKTIKILGIDDSNAHHILCKTIFENGFFSEFSYTGIGGVEACNGIRPNDYNVILLDFSFRDTPDEVDGEWIAKRIKEEFDYQGKIIFVTGRKDVVTRLRENGKMVIQKVFDPKQICSFIRDVFENKIEKCKTKLEGISNHIPKPLMK